MDIYCGIYLVFIFLYHIYQYGIIQGTWYILQFILLFICFLLSLYYMFNLFLRLTSGPSEKYVPFSFLYESIIGKKDSKKI